MALRLVAAPRWENRRPRERFHSRLHYARLASASICYLESRSWLRYQGTLPDSYLVLFAERGRVAHTVRGELMVAAPSCGIVHSPGSEIRVETEPRRHLGLCVPSALVLREARKRLGREVERLNFEPEIDLETGAGATFGHLVRFIHAELSRPGGLRSSSPALERLELSLVDLLLDGQPFTAPNGGHGFLDGGPGVVRRVDELIRTRIDHPLTVGDLAAHAGVSARTLFRTYQRYRGRSPIQALREARLERARQALLEAGPDTSVTQAALRCGFTHLGRFSEVYKRTFGESPSQTIRRVRPSA